MSPTVSMTPTKSPPPKKVNQGKGQQQQQLTAAGAGATTAEGRIIDNLIPKLLTSIEETIEKVLERKLEEFIERKLEEFLERKLEEVLGNKMGEMDRKLEKATERQEIDSIKLKMELEKNEQRLRRDNFIIQGFRETETEKVDDLLEGMRHLCEVLNVPFQREAIGDIHRIGKKSAGKSRPVLVKSNAIQKARIFQKKRELRGNSSLKDNPALEDKVLIYEDLTLPRRKLLQEVKKCSSVEYCYTRDGQIKCKRKDGRFVTIESPDDLFHLGAENVQYSDFYRN